MNARSKRNLFFVAAAFTAAFVLVFLRGRDHSLKRILDTGTIRVGYAVEPPYSFVKPGGEVTGQSPEMAKLIADRLGINTIEWRQAEFGALIDELESGRVDVVAAGMFITPERARRVAFSEPVAKVAQAMLVARGNPLRIHSHRDFLDRPELRAAVLSGSVEERLFKKMGLRDERLVRVPDAATGRAAVESGIAHGLALSAPSVRWMAGTDKPGKIEMAAPFDQPGAGYSGGPGYVAFAFRKADESLREAWNGQIAATLSKEDYAELVEPFGFGKDELPTGETTKDILSR